MSITREVGDGIPAHSVECDRLEPMSDRIQVEAKVVPIGSVERTKEIGQSIEGRQPLDVENLAGP